jgi:hypothetical protein
LTRRDSGFRVSGTQGLGNRETAPDALISNDFLFPSTLSEKVASGKLKSRSSATALGECKPVNSGAPPMGIQRRYQPAPGALDDLVEALYRLLADTVGAKEQCAPDSALERGAAVEGQG